MRWTADRIRNLRKLLGLSQERFADRVGVSAQTVSRWERDESSPRSEIYVRRLDELEQEAMQRGGRS